jgi:hypothetical protein
VSQEQDGAGDLAALAARAGWLRVTVPLWPFAGARILYGILWRQQSKWKVPVEPLERAVARGGRIARLLRWLV